MKSRILAVILSFFISIFLLVPPGFAESNGSLPQSSTQTHKPAIQDDYHESTQVILIEVMSALTCQLTGIDPVKPDGKCLGVDSENGVISYVESHGGAIGIMGNMIVGAIPTDISTSRYIADATSKFGFTRPAYAQPAESGTKDNDLGVGFSGLNAFLPLWKAFRNVVYLLFVLLFVLVGLAIMFRVKIDARTVTSIQNSLPKLVIGLVLITFSYAIVGLLIDVMWVACYLIYEVIAGAGIRRFDPTDFNPEGLARSTPFNVMGGFMGIGGIAKNVAVSIGQVITSLFEGNMGRVVAAIMTGALTSFIGGQFSGIPGGGLVGSIGGALIGGAIGFGMGSKLLGILGGIIAFFVVGIAIMIALFRLWFLLIKTYVYILLGLILGPFWIALGVLPGSKLGFGAWFRDVMANLAVYPAVILMLMLGSAIMESVGKHPVNGQFVPPLIGNPGGANQIAAFIGLGFLLLAPSVASMVRDALKAPQLKYGSAIFQGLSAGTAAPQRVLGGLMGSAFAPSYKIGEGGYEKAGVMDKFLHGFGLKKG